MARRWKIFLIVGILSGVADQVTKIMARHMLPSVPGRDHPIGIPVQVIENYFDWRLSFNPGSAFGLFGGFGGARVFLTVFGLAAVGAIVWMLHKAREDQTRLQWALGLVAGGAIGNLIDRIGFGVVTDFVVWKYHDMEWPTFNVADVALVVGVGLLILDIIKEMSDEAAETVKAKGAAGAKPKGRGGGGKSGGKGGGKAGKGGAARGDG